MNSYVLCRDVTNKAIIIIITIFIILDIVCQG